VRLLQAWAQYCPRLTADAADIADRPEFAERFAVRAAPTVLLGSGDATLRVAGVAAEPMLLAALARLAGPLQP